ncbi:MAG: SpoIID/LytB domain-containing protein [Acidithiobacillales bacterium]
MRLTSLRLRGLAAAGLLLAAVSCAPAPRAAVSPPVPTPPPGPGPTPAPTPTPAPAPPFPEVTQPALDVAIGTDRATASFPLADWLLRGGGRTELRRGALLVRPAAGVVDVEVDGRSEVWPSPVALARADGSPVPYGDSSYRGVLLLRLTPRGTLHVVNRVGIEDYLKGVVPAEMGPRVYDEPEALKAQAVAARTYALKHRGDLANEGYDLCATPRCQVYGGVAVEQPLSSRAVDDTAGEVLVFDGALADTVFTSTCGGRTENGADVFTNAASPRPYLVSVACSGETPVSIRGRPVAKGSARTTTLLGARGRALLASLGKDPTAAGAAAARNAVRERLGLPPRSGPHSLWPASAYIEIADAAGFGSTAILTEEVERDEAPATWSPRARAAFALLSRFQLAGAAALPTLRVLKPEEVAGLWATLLGRLGDFEEIDGRLAAVSGDEIVVKGPKGRATYPLETPALLSGSAEALTPVATLRVYPGDRVRVLVRGGAAVGLVHAPAPAAGTYERESAWIHWTRRFTGAELAAKLRERDPSRKIALVRRLEVLARGDSGRAVRVRLATDVGPIILVGLEIRFALGLPETLFTVVSGRERGGMPVFTFYGRGWGHGVGLCQTGAFGMALAGRAYAEILARYYPGTALVPFASLPTSSAPAAVR